MRKSVKGKFSLFTARLALFLSPLTPVTRPYVPANERLFHEVIDSLHWMITCFHFWLCAFWGTHARQVQRQQREARLPWRQEARRLWQQE
jgi:hypothetical protein